MDLNKLDQAKKIKIDSLANVNFFVGSPIKNIQ